MSIVIEVQGRDELAAAIRSVPHDEPVEIILHRPPNKKPIVYKFDYTQGNEIVAHSGLKRPRRIKSDRAIDERMAKLAVRIMKTPRSLWE